MRLVIIADNKKRALTGNAGSFHNRFRWSRRKLTLLSKVLYRLCLLVVACLVHAVVHVHNFIWHRSRQQGLPAMSAPVSNFALKKRTELQKVLFLTVSSPVCFTPSEKKRTNVQFEPSDARPGSQRPLARTEAVNGLLPLMRF